MDWGDIAGSTGFQVTYPILSALLSATGQRGANVAQGLNTGMAITNRYAQQRQQDEQNAILRQKLGDIFKATDQKPATTLPGSTTNLGLASEEGAGLQALNNEGKPPEATAATSSFGSLAPQPTEISPATSKPMFSPGMQKLGEALSAANRPDLALGIAERALTAKQAAPHTFGTSELGMYRLDENGQPVSLVPGVGRREPTPPRPVDTAVGGTRVSRVYNPDSKQWETTETPLTAAPARQLSPEQADLERARLTTEQARPGLIQAQKGAAQSLSAERQGRLKHLNDVVAKANDPKATAGQASAAMNALIRERDSVETPDEDKPVINDAIRAVRGRLAEIGKAPGAPAPAAAAAPQKPPGKPIGKTKDGKIVYQGPDGKKYVAN